MINFTKTVLSPSSVLAFSIATVCFFQEASRRSEVAQN